jgi:hypothetical protein
MVKPLLEERRDGLSTTVGLKESGKLAEGQFPSSVWDLPDRGYSETGLLVAALTNR